jgi:hypothetical protein
MGRCEQRIFSVSFPQASQTCPNPQRPSVAVIASEDAVYIGRLDEA